MNAVQHNKILLRSHFLLEDILQIFNDFYFPTKFLSLYIYIHYRGFIINKKIRLFLVIKSIFVGPVPNREASGTLCLSSKSHSPSYPHISGIYQHLSNGEQVLFTSIHFLAISFFALAAGTLELTERYLSAASAHRNKGTISLFLQSHLYCLLLLVSIHAGFPKTSQSKRLSQEPPLLPKCIGGHCKHCCTKLSQIWPLVFKPVWALLPLAVCLFY